MLLDLPPQFVWVSDFVERFECAARPSHNDGPIAEHPAKYRLVNAVALDLREQHLNASSGEEAPLDKYRLLDTATSVAARRMTPPPIRATAPASTIAHPQQSRLDKIPLSGVAYRKINDILALSHVPKLSRTFQY